MSVSPDTIIKYATGKAKLANPERNELVTGCCKLLLNASIALDRLSGVIRISEGTTTCKTSKYIQFIG